MQNCHPDAASEKEYASKEVQTDGWQQCLRPFCFQWPECSAPDIALQNTNPSLFADQVADQVVEGLARALHALTHHEPLQRYPPLFALKLHLTWMVSADTPTEEDDTRLRSLLTIDPSKWGDVTSFWTLEMFRIDKMHRQTSTKSPIYQAKNAQEIVGALLYFLGDNHDLVQTHQIQIQLFASLLDHSHNGFAQFMRTFWQSPAVGCSLFFEKLLHLPHASPKLVTH